MTDQDTAAEIINELANWAAAAERNARRQAAEGGTDQEARFAKSDARMAASCLALALHTSRHGPPRSLELVSIQPARNMIDERLERDGQGNG